MLDTSRVWPKSAKWRNSKLEEIHALGGIIRKHPRICAFFLCFAVMLIRAYSRLAYPGLWAEDGSIFLQEHLHLGLSAILEPYAGYFHTIPRFLAFLSASVSLEAFPYFVNVFCILIAAFAFSTFSATGFRDFLPNDWIRVLASVILCFSPGLEEVLANLSNIHWVCYVYLWLLFFSSQSFRISRPEIAFATLCVFTTGESIVLIPLLFWRVFQARRMPLRSNLTNFYFLAILLMSMTLNMYHSSSRPLSFDLAAIADTMVFYVTRSFAIDPFMFIFRDLGLQQVLSGPFIHIIGLLVTLWMILRIWKFDVRLKVSLILGYGCAFGVPLLTWIVRPGSIDSFDTTIASDFLHRYSFMMVPFTIIVWFIALSQKTAHDGPLFRRHSNLIFAAVVALSCLPHFFLRSYKTQDWSAFSQRLMTSKQTCMGQPISMELAPFPAWKLTYDPLRDKACLYSKKTRSGGETQRRRP